MTQIERLKEAERDFTVTEFLCPVCKRKMFTEPSLNGVYVWCGLPDLPRTDGYHCREVVGHGKDSKGAYHVITEKFEKSLK